MLKSSSHTALPRRPTSLDIALWMARPASWIITPRSEQSAPRLATVSKVLVIRLDGIGDLVLTAPLLRELRRNVPDAWITLIVRPETVSLVERCPYIDEILLFDPSVHPVTAPLVRHWRAIKLVMGGLRNRKFDLAIVPRWDVDNYHATFLAYFSGAKWRVGYASSVNPAKRYLNKGYDRFFTHLLDDAAATHEAQRNLAVLPFLGGEIVSDRSEVWLSEEDVEFAAQVLDEAHVGSQEQLVAFAPGAGAAKRRLPRDLVSDLIGLLQSEDGRRVLILGQAGDGEAFVSGLGRGSGNVINLCGKTTLRQAAAIIARSHVFVGTDAGLAHLSAAVGTAVVVVSCHPDGGSPTSPNSPWRFAPWSDRRIVLQPALASPPCVIECTADEPHCIRGIGVDRIYGAVRRFLDPLIHYAAPPGRS